MLGYKRHSYLEKVANLQLSSFEIEHSSSESALKLLSVALGQESRLQAQYVDELKERVLKPLEVLFSHNSTELEFQKAQLREVVEKAKVHNEALIKAKKELDKASDEAKIATDKLLHLSELADEADKLNEEKRRQKEEEHSSSSSSDYPKQTAKVQRIHSLDMPVEKGTYCRVHGNPRRSLGILSLYVSNIPSI